MSVRAVVAVYVDSVRTPHTAADFYIQEKKNAKPEKNAKPQLIDLEFVSQLPTRDTMTGLITILSK
jgi:hypothetical protein